MKAKHRAIINLVFALSLAYMLPVAMARSLNAKQKTKQILDITGVKGGLVVHIGWGDKEM